MVSIDSPVWSTPLLVFRARLLLRPRRLVSIPVHQAALFYAMLCDAHGAAGDTKPSMPDGVLLDAPDLGRITTGPDDPLVMGLTILAGDIRRGQRKAQELVDGLRKIGRHPARGQRLDRFSVDQIQDLTTGHAVNAAGELNPVAPQAVQQQLRDLIGRDQVELCFHSPLRCARPATARREGHGYYDEKFFDAAGFFNRLSGRLQRLGWSGTPRGEWSAIRCVENRLVWLDIGYGSAKSGTRKTLGGAVGGVRLANLPPSAWQPLVWGQLVRLGENTRFGFGGYEIQLDADDDVAVQLAKPTATTTVARENNGVLPVRTPRARNLRDACLAESAVESVEIPPQLESGVIGQTIRQIYDGTYAIDPYARIQISKPGGGSRQLAIPSLRDRTLQRAVLTQLAPAIDQFLETSAIAYRRGLGRDTAVRQIRKAFRSGFQWAVKADFLTFFDTVDHRQLHHRLNAYLADPELVELIMRWVRAGAPDPQRGLPTGSPLSPLLANLFLDHFDEQIAKLGGRLVRYADDFLILCRSEEQASALYQAARAEAENLLLELNRDKSAQFSLREPFEFLGCRFAPREDDSSQWQFDEGLQPARIEDLGWQPARPRAPSQPFPSKLLHGESECDAFSGQTTVIAGPEVQRIDVQGKRLRLELGGGGGTRKLILADINDFVILGDATLSWAAQRRLAEAGIDVAVCDRAGRLQFEILPGRGCHDAAAVLGQVEIAQDDEARRAIASSLVAAKLCNYAALASRYHRQRTNIAGRLHELSVEAGRCESLESLLGIEGSGAALWYGRFQELLGRGFQFTHRVAPDATDPINALLNLAQTVLHRLLCALIGTDGLALTVAALHVAHGKHATLASDLQEPLRHLMDRAVIEASHQLRPSDFRDDPDGPYPLSIQPRAVARFVELVHRMLAIPVAGRGQPQPVTYRRQAARMVRSYKRHCQDRSQPFEPFVHPGRPGGARTGNG